MAVNSVLVDFVEAFLDHSGNQGATLKEARELLKFIPKLFNTLAFRDRLTGQWRYEYGDPIGLPSVIGDHTFPRMGRLYRALKEAHMRLTEKDMAKWCEKLFNPAQHQDILEEMAPIYHLEDGIGVFPERKISQTNNTDIDWELIVPNLPNFFLEVKHRKFDLEAGLREIISRLPETSQPGKPTHDTDLLFVNLEKKFESCKPRDRLQGAWISTSGSSHGICRLSSLENPHRSPYPDPFFSCDDPLASSKMKLKFVPVLTEFTTISCILLYS